jgi:hypothetical protein
MKKTAFVAVTLLLSLICWLISSSLSRAQFGGSQNEETTIKVIEASSDEVDAYLAELLTKEAALPAHYQAYLEAETRIKTALSKKIEIDFDKKPLTEVVQFFQEELDLNIQLDMKVLEEVPIDTSEPVTVHVADITTRSALEFVLSNLEEPLTWTVRHEMLMITTLEEADALMQIKFFDVTDLVVVRGENNELSLDYVQLKAGISHLG